MNTSSLAALNALDRAEAAVSSLTERLNRACLDCDAAVRDHPREAMLLAFAAGAMATRQPLNSMLAAGCKMAWSFAPAALAIFGAFKLARRLAHLDEARPRLTRMDNNDGMHLPDTVSSSIATEGVLT